MVYLSNKFNPMDTLHFKFRKGYICILLMLFPLFVQSQYNNCPNIDFSQGTLANWIGNTSVYPYNTPGTNIGTPQAPYPSPPYYYTTGFVVGRHTLITTATPDPFTCGNVMTLPPGEKQCIRLGNGGIGSWGNGVVWQREFLTYALTVTPNSSMIIYKYAAVLQDQVPLHDKAVRPRFIVTVRDLQDKIIDSICTSKEVFADSTSMHLVCDLKTADSLGGHAESPGNIMYCNWTTIPLDLRKYMGQAVMLRFETWDCGLGGHFGYAYLTAKCAAMKINASTCIPGETVTLTAPEGFSYKWLPSGEVTQSIVIPNAKLGDSAHVELTSPSGCKSFLNIKLFQNRPTADFNIDSMVCAGDPFHFTDNSGPEIKVWNWDFGDGTTDTVPNPVHIYSTHGTYQVKLVVKNSDACSDTISNFIVVCPNTGVNELEQKFSFHVYPNPSTGLFKLEALNTTTGNIQVQISDLLGRVIYSEKNFLKNGSLQKELDIKEQPDGIYFLTIRNAEYSKVIKLVKKNMR